MILPDTEAVDTAPFWAAARDSRLVVQRCDACGRLRFPPHPFCSACQSEAVSWIDVSGRGKLWSFIVVHQPTLPAFESKLPFPVVVVELEEDATLRMTGNVIARPDAEINSVNPGDLRIGAPFQVSFRKQADDVTLPCWMPVTA